MNLLRDAHIHLHWPPPDQITNPPGSGPSVYAQLAKRKIGSTINLLLDGVGVQVGVLTGNPLSDTTESPIAIICEVPKSLSSDTLRQIHKLAWNFSRSPLIIIFEPHLIRAWTCCEPPPKENEVGEKTPEILRVSSLSEKAARALDWVELASGEFFKKHKERFKKELCADYTLLKTLDYVRQELLNLKLNKDICHDLLARVIFIQFLFHRKDSSGIPALSEKRLNRLYEEKILSRKYSELSEILSNYNDSYAFFRWLNERFNGDLFPGKGATVEEREDEWQFEIKHVKPQHLRLLSDFVSGRLHEGQITFWPMYSFDAIPLEFISSIYEQFVGKKAGVVYTPSHIVDFILDGVLPWNSNQWNLKILDPACGSGIFLVKAYQRLIHRWKISHPGGELRTDILRGLLENNLFGVDNDSHAVRVASFSLYLAMCDEIDPKHYWNKIKFPRLRDRRIICADFFQEDKEGFRTVEDKGKYDLVIGNPPWGKNSATPDALKWSEEHEWKITYRDMGTLFLSKAAALTKPKGHISMLQSATGLLFNQVESAQQFREKFFSTFKVEEVTNLSALRFGLFKKAISPVCIVTMKSTLPHREPLNYICPKPVCTSEDDYRIIIESNDINSVYPHEASKDPLVWTALIWGGRRDLALIRRLQQHHNLKKIEDDNMVTSADGIIRGQDEYHKALIGRRILETDEFPSAPFLYLNAERLNINNNPYTHRLTNLSAFEMPQLIIKKGWTTESRRFHARLVKSNKEVGGVICNSNYISIHAKENNKAWLEAACLSCNSKLAVYYLLLSSGRFASYRPAVYKKDLLNVPIPEPRSGLLQQISSLEHVDQRIRQLLEFKGSEWALVEDLFDYTLPDFKGDISSPGRQKTRTLDKEDEDHLKIYCDYFLKVLKAGFGRDKNICATIYQEENNSMLPVRLIAVHFDWPGQSAIRIESIDSPKLINYLLEIDKRLLKNSLDTSGGIFYRRVVRVYDSLVIDGRTVPTIFLIKSDQIRYWTRSMAMRDADEVAGDIVLWNQSTKSRTDS